MELMFRFSVCREKDEKDDIAKMFRNIIILDRCVVR